MQHKPWLRGILWAAVRWSSFFDVALQLEDEDEDESCFHPRRQNIQDVLYLPTCSHVSAIVHDGQPKSRNFSIRECRTAHAHTHTHTHLLSISSPVIKSVKRSPKPWFSVHPSHISCRINANRNAQQQSRSHENKLKYANIKKNYSCDIHRIAIEMPHR